MVGPFPYHAEERTLHEPQRFRCSHLFDLSRNGYRLRGICSPHAWRPFPHAAQRDAGQGELAPCGRMTGWPLRPNDNDSKPVEPLELLKRSVAANRQDRRLSWDRRKGERRAASRAVSEERRRETVVARKAAISVNSTAFLAKRPVNGDVSFPRPSHRRSAGGNVRVRETLIIGERGQIVAEIRVERLQSASHA